MCSGIEKRSKELDQAVFILVLVLNPFQKLLRFGDKANIDPFVFSTQLIAVSSAVDAAHAGAVAPAWEQTAAMQSLSATFMQYLAGTGPFANWENPQIQEVSSDDFEATLIKTLNCNTARAGS
ncbi:hypothetical protein B0H19DRAFT_1083304 [Mycena capillaripes]|nr:hypothetical protein B0H19DRAFT_1083304 [Mycena capillaripes]